MSGSVNRVMILGNLVRDPEIRSMSDGGKVATFSVATSERWKDKMTGERKERSEFHRVAVFNEKIAEIVEQYLKKGRKVYLEGQLQTRKWTDQEGQERYSTEVVLPRFRGELVLLDNRGGEGDSFLAPGSSQAEQPALKQSNDPDDEIPF